VRCHCEGNLLADLPDVHLPAAQGFGRRETLAGGTSSLAGESPKQSLVTDKQNYAYRSYKTAVMGIAGPACSGLAMTIHIAV
jgi:hypothetical protein